LSPILPGRWAAACSLTVLAGGLAHAQATSAPPAARWEGAIGLVVHNSPNYPGAADSSTKGMPGFYLRYGRFTATNAGGFVTRRADDVERGVSAELVRRDDLRVSLSARFDAGRDADSDAALRGLPDLRATVRARLSVVQRLSDGWQLSAALSPDIVGRGGGAVAEAGIGREWRPAAGWRARADASLTWADGRYMDSRFGITTAQSAITGLRAWQPGSGLRDLGLGLGLNTDFGPHWIGFAGIGANHLIGGAKDSPLTHRVNSLNFNSGLAWRF